MWFCVWLGGGMVGIDLVGRRKCGIFEVENMGSWALGLWGGGVVFGGGGGLED